MLWLTIALNLFFQFCKVDTPIKKEPEKFEWGSLGASPSCPADSIRELRPSNSEFLRSCRVNIRRCCKTISNTRLSCPTEECWVRGDLTVVPGGEMSKYKQPGRDTRRKPTSGPWGRHHEVTAACQRCSGPVYEGKWCVHG